MGKLFWYVPMPHQICYYIYYYEWSDSKKRWDARVHWDVLATGGFSRWRALAWLKGYWNIFVYRFDLPDTWWWY